MVIAETFEKHYFRDGHNLNALVYQDDSSGLYYVEIGHKTYRYKSLSNALNKYHEYLKYASLAKAHHVDGSEVFDK